MVGVARRLRAVAVAAQVGGDDREALGEPRRDLVPHDVGLRVAVQEQQRRAGAARQTAISARRSRRVAARSPRTPCAIIPRRQAVLQREGRERRGESQRRGLRPRPHGPAAGARARGVRLRRPGLEPVAARRGARRGNPRRRAGRGCGGRGLAPLPRRHGGRRRRAALARAAPSAGSARRGHGHLASVRLCRAAARLAERGVAWVDAPVSGGPDAIVERRLAVMAGGNAADVARARPHPRGGRRRRPRRRAGRRPRGEADQPGDRLA